MRNLNGTMAGMLTRRNPCTLTIILAVMLGSGAQAQSLSSAATSPIQILRQSASGERRTAPLQLAYDELPDAPTLQTATLPDQQPGGSISGAVLDPHGAAVVGARVTLEIVGDSKTQRTASTGDGGFFYLTALAPATYRLTVTATGFAPFVMNDIVLQLNEIHDLHTLSLRLATTSTNVQVTLTREELAEAQIKEQEKQRVIAIFPNFYATYNWNAAPLTSKQKFKLALRTSIDPATFLGAGIAAGIEQGTDSYQGYGQGAEGYAKRFGASYTDAFNGTIIGGAILPSLLHQDPRYFYKGTGTIRSRILYAIATVVICKGDNGKWQPNYSNVLGNLASAGISNAYYPSTDRNGAVLTIRNSLIGTASGAIGSLFQEFLIKKISTGIPSQPASPPPSPPSPSSPNPSK